MAINPPELNTVKTALAVAAAPAALAVGGVGRTLAALVVGGMGGRLAAVALAAPVVGVKRGLAVAAAIAAIYKSVSFYSSFYNTNSYQNAHLLRLKPYTKTAQPYIGRV